MAKTKKRSKGEHITRGAKKAVRRKPSKTSKKSGGAKADNLFTRAAKDLISGARTILDGRLARDVTVSILGTVVVDIIKPLVGLGLMTTEHGKTVQAATAKIEVELAELEDIDRERSLIERIDALLGVIIKIDDLKPTYRRLATDDATDSNPVFKSLLSAVLDGEEAVEKFFFRNDLDRQLPPKSHKPTKQPVKV